MNNTGALVRQTILDIVHHGGASHIGSSLSVVEIIRAVYRAVDVEKIRQGRSDRDRVIVSKGHCAAAVYSVMHEQGLLSEETLRSYHMNGSLLSGHVSHFVDFVEHSTGALGHALSVAVGVSIGLGAKGLDGSRCYVVVGDGELHEGSNWEAIMLAGHLGLSNLCVLVDYNGLSGIGKVRDCCGLESLEDRFAAFGFRAVETDGHDEEGILSLIREVGDSGKPTAIVCRTVKGKGVSFMENDNVWHYRPPNKEAYDKAILELQ